MRRFHISLSLEKRLINWIGKKIQLSNQHSPTFGSKCPFALIAVSVDLGKFKSSVSLQHHHGRILTMNSLVKEKIHILNRFQNRLNFFPFCFFVKFLVLSMLAKISSTRESKDNPDPNPTTTMFDCWCDVLFLLV